MSLGKEDSKMLLQSQVRGRTLLSVVVSVLLLVTAASGQNIPPPGSVTINDIPKISGTGCPSGTFETNISQDNLAFTVAFSAYIAQIGDGIDRREARKTCIIFVDLNIPPGFQFTIVNVDYRGFADLDAGVKGTLKAAYYFQGEPVARRAPVHVLTGPLFDNYEVRESFATITFSPCGGGRTLVFNTEVAMSRPRPGTGLGGTMGVDTITGEFEQEFAFMWQRCTPP
jgi:hypothetical protein